MCLGVPGKLVEIDRSGDTPTGKVDFGGVSRDVCLSFVPEAVQGDYVLIHVGFAISVLDEEEAHKTMEILKAMGEFDAGEEAVR